MKKTTFYTEAAYVFGIIFLALGTALSELAGFGMSMIVAPAYIIHLAVSEFLPFFSFGMAEYTFQALLILGMMVILRRFRTGYLFSFVTAVVYGMALDGFVFICTPLATESLAPRIVYLILGILFCAAGVAMHFKTYISPEAYELVVKEISAVRGIDTYKFKTVYDLSSCVVAIMLSFLFFGIGVFRGIGIGTVICAVVNGTLIGLISKVYDRIFEFKDGMKLRRLFEK